MYSGQERTELTDEVMKAIQEMDSVELGKFFDNLYHRLNGDFDEYCLTLDHATYLLEQDMTDEEIEAQDQKMRNSKPGIKRPRSAHEMTLDEMFGRLNDETYWDQLNHEAITREMIPIDESFTVICADESFIEVKIAIGKDERNYPPHFHFYLNSSPGSDIPNSRYDGGCILFQETKYFIHDVHSTRLGKNAIRVLIDWLNSEHFSGGNMWHHIISIWNENNPDRLVLLDQKIPPYNV